MTTSSTLVVIPCCITLVATITAFAAYRRGLVAATTGSGVHALSAKKDPDEGNKSSSSSNETATTMDGMVERVLSVWFDGPTPENHRTKWFAQV